MQLYRHRYSIKPPFSSKHSGGFDHGKGKGFPYQALGVNTQGVYHRVRQGFLYLASVKLQKHR